MTTITNYTLATEIDRCVMCGMCSQYCPTYQLTRNENESPRGRIALVNAMNKGQLSISDKLVEHLDHCTYCRACEDFCPSGVQFELIMDEARVIISRQRALPRQQQRVLNILASPDQTRRLGRWLQRYQRWGVQRLMRISGLLSLTGFKQEDNLLPSIPDIPVQPIYSPSASGHRGDVALFTGCVSSILDREVQDASRQILNALGYGVYSPAGQTCCGALHQHSGDTEISEVLAKKNLASFMELDIEAIVHTSTGCTSFLKQYDQLLKHSDQHTDASTFSNKIQDINQFLSGIDWPENLDVSPLPRRVAVHEPCSARNVLHQAEKSYRLLEKIPGLELVPLPGNDECCGAAGSQLLAPTKISLQLRQHKLDALLNLNASKDETTRHLAENTIDTIVTTNIGCALHLAAGLREKGITVDILHPVILLKQQMDASAACTPARTSAKVTA